MRRVALLLALCAAAGAAAPPAPAAPGRIALGLADGASPAAVAAAAEALTGGKADATLAPLGALVVRVADRDSAARVLARLPGVEYVEPLTARRRLAFVPTDPLVFFQWYVPAIHAFDYWPEVPSLQPVRVAVIDSGVDASHPELRGRIVAARSFVKKGKATVDERGHGTMVAGEIAAALDNAEGIAGVGFPVELLVAKVAEPDGIITVEAEAKAIRWAVENGAQVVNLSLGGHRDPGSGRDDEYSPLEQAAVEYAYESGAVVVAATGNCDDHCPYRFADYPAALPHVLGVSALTQLAGVPDFSHRDAVYNDLAAPGVGIVSTFPLALSDPACSWPGYSICAPSSLRNGNGTSFAVPLVSAAAALLLATRPSLTPSQVMAVLERSAADLGPLGRDALTGNGELDVLAALTALEGPLPPADRFETNDDAGASAHTLSGKRPAVDATVDYFDDPNDVYRVYVRAGRRLRVRLNGPAGGKPMLVLWRPGTAHVTEVTQVAVRSGAILARERAASPSLGYVAKASGWYYVEVKAPIRGGGAYHLSIRM